MVILPEARWSNAREALALALSLGDEAQQNVANIITPQRTNTSVALRPPPAPAPTPVPVKAPALRSTTPTGTLVPEVPSAPVSKKNYVRDVTNTPSSNTFSPRPAAPLAPPSAAPFPSASSAKPSPPPAEIQSELGAVKKTSRLSPATTAPFSAQEGTRPPVKLRVAARPTAPISPPPAPVPESPAPPTPASAQLFSQDETPLIPIPSGTANKRRLTPNPEEGTQSVNPSVKSNTQPAFAVNKSVPSRYTNPPIALGPSVKTPQFGQKGSSRLTTPPFNKTTSRAGNLETTEESLKSSPWENAGRYLGYSAIAAILCVIANTLYHSYKEMHGDSGDGVATHAAPARGDTPSDPAAVSSHPATARPNVTNQSPAPIDSITQQTPAPTPPAPPPPTDEFIAAVNGFKVTGVLIGKPLRVIINGHRIETGDLVNEKLGIRLIGHESDTRSLIFEDRTKAQTKLRY